MADDEVTYQDCIGAGFVLSLVFFFIVVFWIIGQGFAFEGSGAGLVILAVALILGIAFFTFVIFTPIVYVLKKWILPKVK